MSDYLLQHGTRRVPQSEPLRPDQVQNSAGGYSWAIDEWTRLRRWLILGSEGGSYYATEHKLTSQNVEAVLACLRADGLRTVQEIVDVSHAGRAPKNDPALFALAVAISKGDQRTRRAAAEALPAVARTGTHLYHFVAYAETQRGWGRTLRWAVSNWYDRNPAALALQAVKYRQRDGWSHRDLLRLAHPKVADRDLAAVYAWIAGKGGATEGLIAGYEAAQQSTSPARTAELVRELRLPREALRTEHLTDPDVWRALLEADMPMTAMLRNLPTMTRLGVLGSGAHRGSVLAKLTDEERLRKSRIHPMTVLIALRTYAGGHSLRGSSTWQPHPSIIDALDTAFYLAFENVPSTGKAHLLALDISGSMDGAGYWDIRDSALSPREASAAMALVTLHAEPDCEVVGFSHELIPLPLSRRQRLDDAVHAISDLPFGATDCALPMLWAQQGNRQYEQFVVYTDSETWFGHTHPKQALDAYRANHGAARLAVIGMVSNGFSIADPQDAGMMDFVGFDTNTPALMSEFAAGRL